jgi:hypothetical protein
VPTVFYYRGMRVHFFANEGNPREPMHVHVDSADATAKLWLDPEVQVANSWGYSRRELRLMVEMIERRRDEIARIWNAFFRTGA